MSSSSRAATAAPLVRRDASVALLLLFVHCAVCRAENVTPPVYPLKVGPGGRHLVDQRGRPFLYNADTGWHLFYKLTTSETEEYLEDRRRKGFNSVQVQLLTDGEYYPDREGAFPFLTAGDLSTPNEQFFARVDRTVRRAGEKGIQLVIAPAWLGCCKGAWREKLKANGEQKCRAFGRYLGRRYKNFPNIIWLLGGDKDPGEYLPFVSALAEGIKEHDKHHLMTAHPGSPHSATEMYEGEAWLDLNATYTYSPDITSVGRPQYHVYAASLADYNRSPVKPFFLLESAYENERGATPQVIRRQAYWSLLSGSTGHAFGNLPIYVFGDGWQLALGGPGSQDMSLWYSLFAPRRWHELVPDRKHEVLTAGYGGFDGAPGKDEKHALGFDHVTAARTPDGKLFIAYLPTARPAVTINFARLAGKLRGRWFDPAGGQFLEVEGSPFDGRAKRTLTTPGKNAGGGDDWVLVLESLVK